MRRNDQKRRGPLNMPREEMAQIYAVHEQEGLSYRAIARRFGHSSESVRRWLTRPEKYDPYIDEVAVERALAGDREVYDALTLWEEEEFVHRFAKRREALVTTEERQAYSGHLTAALGLDKDTLKYKVRRMREREAA